MLTSIAPALITAWILDIDTTIKPLYGKQEGAQVSYNPHKPGRPSHALHTYWMANLHLALDVVVSPCKEHSAGIARPVLMEVLDALGPEQRPKLVRGDCGFGNEPFIAELDQRAQSYLFKLNQTAGVKKLLSRQFAREDWSTPGPADQGWSAVEDALKLSGWTQARRVIVLRRAVKIDLALSRQGKSKAQGSGEPSQVPRLGEQDIKPAHVPWHWSTTGGVGIVERPSLVLAWRPSRAAHCQCPCRPHPRQRRCEAVAWHKSMEGVCGLRHRQDHPPSASLGTTQSADNSL